MVHIRKVPKATKVELDIPENMVGKPVVFTAVEQPSKTSGPIRNTFLDELRGSISPERAEEMQRYIIEARKEWDRDVWSTPTL